MQSRFLLAGLVLLGLLAPGVMPGAGPQVALVKNINTMPTAQTGLRPRSFVQAGAVTYFAALNARNQEELWKTDGTAAGTVRVWDAAVRAYDYITLDAMTPSGGRLFFSIEDAVHGRELWVTDGSGAPEGTHLVADLLAGPGSSMPRKLTPYQNGLMFVAQGTLQKRGLWFTDGTAAGTRLVMSLPADDESSDSSNNGQWIESDGYFYFDTYTAGTLRVYRTDGTAQGTLLLKELVDGQAGFVKAGKVVLFRGAAKLGNDELWKTDGTVKGTTLLKEIRAGAKGSYPMKFAAVGNLAYFIAFTNDTTGSLWRSDGTAAGTRQVAALPVGVGGSRLVPVGNSILFDQIFPEGFPSQIGSVSLATGKFEKIIEFEIDQGGVRSPAAAGGKAFFATVDPDNRESLWVTDGTKAGTRKIEAAALPQGESFGQLPGVIGDEALFPAYAPASGTELWSSDGTEAGTQIVYDDVIQDGGSSPYSLKTVGGLLYFAADDGVHGHELWKSDGSAAGTVMVKDLWPGETAGLLNASYPLILAEMNGIVYFSAADGTAGRELWRTDGTEAGTRRVCDINPGTANASPKNAVVFGDRLFFAATSAEAGEELWISDGTEAGTSLYANVNPDAAGTVRSSSPRSLIVAGSTLYFVASGPNANGCLWQMAVGGAPSRVGTIQQIGEVIARPPTPGASYKPGQWLLYAGTQTLPEYQFWITDGTQEGTLNLGGFSPGIGGALESFQLMADGDVVFCHRSSYGFSSLVFYRARGAGFATLQLLPTQSYLHRQILVAGNRLYFTVTSSGSGSPYEVWTVDTASGAPPVRLYQGAALLVKTVQGSVFFIASKQGRNSSLWTSDGSAASTREITGPDAYLLPNTGINSQEMEVMGSHLYLNAMANGQGQELHSFSLESALLTQEVAGDQTRTLTAGGTLDLGVQTVGLPRSRTLRLTNLGTQPLTGLTIAQPESAALPDYGIAPGSVASLAGGQSVDVEITFTPAQGGTRAGALEVRRTSGLLFNLVLSGTGVAADAAPVITQHPASRIVKAGASVTFAADAVSAQELTLDWRRDGDATVGTQGTLTLTNVQPSDVGNYALTFINVTDSVTTLPAALAVVTPAVPEAIVAEHHTLTLSCTANAPAGCTLAYQWRVDGHPLTDDGRILGSRTATLSIADHASAIYEETGSWDFQIPPYEGRYDCLVTLIAPDRQETVSHGITQVSVLPVPTIYFYPPTILLGEAVDIQIGTDVPATRFSAKGLPPGLTLNPATGRITGAPTKVLPVNKATGEHGSYLVVFTAGNDSGDGPSETLSFRVVPAIPAGAYDGLLGRSDWIEGSLGGRVTVTATTTGAQSGKLLYEGKSYALAKPVIIQELTHGDLGDAVIEFTVPRGKTLPALKLRMTTDWSSSNVTLTDGEPGHTVTGWVRNQTQRSDRAALAGLFTWSLRNQDPLLNSDLRVPSGAGFLTATVSKTATVTWKGKLADGTAVTGSGLLTDAGFSSGTLQVPVHQDLYSLKGSVHGWALMENSVSPSDEVTLEWFKNALPATSKERRYKDGIRLHSVTLQGGRYTPPGKGETLFGYSDGAAGTVSLLSPGIVNGGLAHSFALTKTNKAVLDPFNAESPVKVLSFNAAQGTFKGSFTLSDPNPAVPTRPWTRVVPFEGVILPASYTMHGHFMLPELPQAGPPATTLTTSPIRSGMVQIDF